VHFLWFATIRTLPMRVELPLSKCCCVKSSGSRSCICSWYSLPKVSEIVRGSWYTMADREDEPLHIFIDRLHVYLWKIPARWSIVSPLWKHTKLKLSSFGKVPFTYRIQSHVSHRAVGKARWYHKSIAQLCVFHAFSVVLQ